MLKKVEKPSIVDQAILDAIELKCLRRKRLIRFQTRFINSIKGSCRWYAGKFTEEGYRENSPESDKLCDAVMDHRTKCLKEPEKAKFRPKGIEVELWQQVRDCFFWLLNTSEKLARLDKELETLAKQLPFATWIKGSDVPGFSLLNYSLLIGACGDLNNYNNPGKLWKRLGLAPIAKYSKKGVLVGIKAASTWRREGGLTEDDWIAAGYSPQRRSMSWNFGSGLLRAGIRDKKPTNPYTQIYHDRKKREKKLYPELPDRAHHLRAQRVMEKVLLKNIWQKWRKQAKRAGRSSERRSLRD